MGIPNRMEGGTEVMSANKNTETIVNFLCGWSTGSASDGIIEYMNQSDCSLASIKRIQKRADEILAAQITKDFQPNNTKQNLLYRVLESV